VRKRAKCGGHPRPIHGRSTRRRLCSDVFFSLAFKSVGQPCSKPIHESARRLYRISSTFEGVADIRRWGRNDGLYRGH